MKKAKGRNRKRPAGEKRPRHTRTPPVEFQWKFNRSNPPRGFLGSGAILKQFKNKIKCYLLSKSIFPSFRNPGIRSKPALLIKLFGAPKPILSGLVTGGNLGIRSIFGAETREMSNKARLPSILPLFGWIGGWIAKTERFYHVPI